MLLVAVTGSIGMGKSTVAQMFKEHGYGVYNADDTVHYIYEKDKEVIAKVESKFPGSTKNGVVNRIALRDILNKDPKKFRDLEQIVHPVTRNYQVMYIKKLVEEKKTGCILDIPLLLKRVERDMWMFQLSLQLQRKSSGQELFLREKFL